MTYVHSSFRSQDFEVDSRAGDFEREIRGVLSHSEGCVFESVEEGFGGGD